MSLFSFEFIIFLAITFVGYYVLYGINKLASLESNYDLPQYIDIRYYSKVMDTLCLFNNARLKYNLQIIIQCSHSILKSNNNSNKT